MSKHRVGLLSLLACLATVPGQGIKIAAHAEVESDIHGYGKLYTEDEIKKCQGFVGKGGVLVSEEEDWVHAINSCGGGIGAAVVLVVLLS